MTVRNEAGVFVNLVQRVDLRQVSQRGHTDQLPHHVSPQVVRGQLVTVEVGAVDPNLRQQPITAVVRGQEDRVLRTGRLLQLKEKTIVDIWDHVRTLLNNEQYKVVFGYFNRDNNLYVLYL